MIGDWMDWASVAAGATLGWLAHWTLDALFWRWNGRILDADTLATARSETDAKIAVLHAERDRLSSEINRLAPLEQKCLDLQAHIARLDASRTEMEQALEAAREQSAILREEVATSKKLLASKPANETSGVEDALVEIQPTSATTNDSTPEPIVPTIHFDDFTSIEGLDEVSQSLLHEAHIRSFSDLAQASPDALFAVIRPARGQQFEPELWVAAASKKLKEGKSK